eukprot:2751774-Alexandrium_andersonii.AAC.1
MGKRYLAGPPMGCRRPRGRSQRQRGEGGPCRGPKAGPGALVAGGIGTASRAPVGVAGCATARWQRGSRSDPACAAGGGPETSSNPGGASAAPGELDSGTSGGARVLSGVPQVYSDQDPAAGSGHEAL